MTPTTPQPFPDITTGLRMNLGTKFRSLVAHAQKHPQMEHPSSSIRQYSGSTNMSVGYTARQDLCHLSRTAWDSQLLPSCWHVIELLQSQILVSRPRNTNLGLVVSNHPMPSSKRNLLQQKRSQPATTEQFWAFLRSDGLGGAFGRFDVRAKISQ